MKRVGPFQGYRVVDFGWVWAGTVLGHILADWGAEVIKIESRHRLDGMRLGTVFELGEAVELNPNFHNLNRNKLSATIDFTQPEGRELILRLIKQSDIVVENYTPNVLRKYALDYESISKAKSDIIMISLSAAGGYGPLSDIVAYATIISAISGIDSLIGYPGEKPLGFKHAYADPTASLFGAFAVMAALHYRKRTGQGQYIDLSEWEATTGLIGEAIMDYTMNGRVQGLQGNGDSAMAPHGVYPSKGEDRWVSIAVKTDDEWRRFRKAIGSPQWSLNEAYDDAFGRLQHATEIDREISSWTVQYTDYEATDLLQKAGVAASPVLSTDDLFVEPHFNARQSFLSVDHPITGGDVLYGAPWKIKGVSHPPARHAPLLGEHNSYVLGDILGLGQDEIERLIEAKIVY